MTRIFTVFLPALVLVMGAGCASKPPKWGHEDQLSLPPGKQQVWAVAPVLDLSGQGVDPILQADLVFEQVQQVKGLVVVPVNRVVEAMVQLGLTRISTPDEAAMVRHAVGADALVLVSITIYDPYNPPKVGASMQIFGGLPRGEGVDVMKLTRQASSDAVGVNMSPQIWQVAQLFDAANGTTRSQLRRYAAGRYDPTGPMQWREYLLSMDRYNGFVYHELTSKLLGRLRRAALDADKRLAAQ